MKVENLDGILQERPEGRALRRFARIISEGSFVSKWLHYGKTHALLSGCELVAVQAPEQLV